MTPHSKRTPTCQGHKQEEFPEALFSTNANQKWTDTWCIVAVCLARLSVAFRRKNFYFDKGLMRIDS